MEQETLDELGFSLDLIYLATGLGCFDAPCGTRSTPPEVEELESTLRRVVTGYGAE